VRNLWHIYRIKTTEKGALKETKKIGVFETFDINNYGNEIEVLSDDDNFRYRRKGEQITVQRREKISEELMICAEYKTNRKREIFLLSRYFFSIIKGDEIIARNGHFYIKMEEWRKVRQRFPGLSYFLKRSVLK